MKLLGLAILALTAFGVGIATVKSSMVLRWARHQWRTVSRSQHHVVTLDFQPIADAIAELSLEEIDAVPNILVPGFVHASDQAATKIFEATKQHLAETVEELRDFRLGFEDRLRAGWRPALELYEAIQTLATELGSDFNRTHRPQASLKQDYVFEALTRIHGRACLTAAEVGALLRAGFATGAMTRWRTLHELATVAYFIKEQGEDVARRYLEHDVVARHAAAKLHQEYAEQIAEEPFSQADFEQLRSRVDELVRAYGPPFLNDYGWAAAALSKKRPTFADIASAVRLDHWKPFVRLASDGVHAGPHGGFWDMGIHPALDVIPAGPSHFGLADPAAHSLTALAQVTVALLTHNFDQSGTTESADDGFLQSRILLLAQLKALMLLVEEASELFVSIQLAAQESPPQVRDWPHVWDVSAH